MRTHEPVARGQLFSGSWPCASVARGICGLAPNDGSALDPDPPVRGRGRLGGAPVQRTAGRLPHRLPAGHWRPRGDWRRPWPARHPAPHRHRRQRAPSGAPPLRGASPHLHARDRGPRGPASGDRCRDAGSFRVLQTADLPLRPVFMGPDAGRGRLRDFSRTPPVGIVVAPVRQPRCDLGAQHHVYALVLLDAARVGARGVRDPAPRRERPLFLRHAAHLDGRRYAARDCLFVGWTMLLRRLRSRT